MKMYNQISSQAHELVKLAQVASTKTKTKIIALTSGKGGVGKTTLSANLAYFLASKGFKIAIIDADIGLANLQIHFDIKPEFSFYDYIDKKVKLKDVLLKTKHKNVHLCAGKSGYKYANAQSSFVYTQIARDIAALGEYDYILIDTGAGINEYVQEFLAISDDVIAITTTDPSAITDLYALIKLMSLKKKRLYLIFNETKNYNIGETITQSLKKLALKNRLPKDFMVKYLGNVVKDENIVVCTRKRSLFLESLKGSESVKSFSTICEKLIKEMKKW